MEKYAVQLMDVVKKFGDFTAVNGISLNIKEGELFGILGPNGAGKTTTINMILSLLEPTSGKIIIGGLDNSKHLEAIKQMLGLMTQETVVENDLTARENLEVFARLYHVPADEIEGRVEEALKEAELVDFANKKAGTFSGGMQRRLALVKSMIQRPRILILDEPTTGLDIQNRVKMWEHIRELQQRGVTIILTTQYLEEADELCERVAIIDHGKIKALGTVSELKRLVGTGRVLEIVLETNSTAEKVASMLHSKFKLSCTVKGDKVTTTVEAHKDDFLAKITAQLDKSNIKVLSLGMHMPTLDDVFIKLTGSGMRDTTGENVSAMSKMRWGRG